MFPLRPPPSAPQIRALSEMVAQATPPAARALSPPDRQRMVAEGSAEFWRARAEGMEGEVDRVQGECARLGALCREREGEIR